MVGGAGQDLPTTFICGPNTLTVPSYYRISDSSIDYLVYNMKNSSVGYILFLPRRSQINPALLTGVQISKEVFGHPVLVLHQHLNSVTILIVRNFLLPLSWSI